MEIFVAVMGPHIPLTSISTVTEVYHGPASYFIIDLLDENWCGTYYEGARQEATAASGEALKGFTDLRSTLVSRTCCMLPMNRPYP